MLVIKGQMNVSTPKNIIKPVFIEKKLKTIKLNEFKENKPEIKTEVSEKEIEILETKAIKEKEIKESINSNKKKVVKVYSEKQLHKLMKEEQTKILEGYGIKKIPLKEKVRVALILKLQKGEN